MWAQLITMRMKPGKEQELAAMFGQLQAIEQPGSGLLRTMIMQDQNDPTKAHVLVVFDSEEKARARETDPRRQEGLKTLQSTMPDLVEDAPEFADLTVLYDGSP